MAPAKTSKALSVGEDWKQRKTRLCMFQREGRCTRGEACTFAHTAQELRPKLDFFKTQLCAGYRRGHCDQGRSCRFAHGPEELRLEPRRDADLLSGPEKKLHGLAARAPIAPEILQLSCDEGIEDVGPEIDADCRMVPMPSFLQPRAECVPNTFDFDGGHTKDYLQTSAEHTVYKACQNNFEKYEILVINTLDGLSDAEPYMVTSLSAI
eukprot:TRINITY_DN50073_c0_g1_i1.p2 TRINITY_DN50073_c0_g1~~TRINITY_DN50073_c0_g1_i1.p2  ORF type:complete len:209 (+),score=33.44 TRINITY_DN50073_c0_g1_i1:77-703(+)